ncbi:hypothetical protein BJY01DRAFT_236736 [Aspergillus pseudoustus]|uniref:Zn(2)-C6 fungal-type domain-containing protein n=1 Tax=Aspergillus pseudoustus TaxID=1810923 RepID=A0ABR4JKE7_9EURO
MSRAKPSRSCANCRAIKRRCDKQRPHCGQCLRTRETCEGYRDEWELIFRDQTNHTIKRSKEKTKSPEATATCMDMGPRTPAGSSPPAHPLSPSLDEVGVNYFLHNFIIGGHSPAHGYLNYIPVVYSADGEHPTLVASMAAVGLVALANATRRPELARHARTKYSEAIHLVNTALSSPVESLKDSILMSVISLGVFEHVSNVQSWARHVQGAAALLVARGKSQFSSTAAMLMFSQVRTDLVFTCVHGHKPFPQEMWELQEEAAKHVDSSRAIWLLGVLATRHANLLYEVRKNEGEIPWTYFLEEANRLRRDFQDMLELLAVQEPYTSARASEASDPEIFHNGRFDLYQGSWAIRVWNNARMLEMVFCNIMYYLLNKILAMDLAPPTRAHLQFELRETFLIQAKLADDMLATVPQGLGLVSPAPDPPPPAHLSSTNVPGGFLLTWCLYTVGQSMVTSSATRQWIARRLRDIGQHAGNAVALQLLDVIVKIDKIRLPSMFFAASYVSL